MFIPIGEVTANPVVKWSLAVDDGSSGVLRLKAGGLKVTMVIGILLLECGSKVATENLHCNIY